MARDVPRFSTCSVANCKRPGVRGSSCGICKRHLCKKHLAPSFHTCNLDISDAAWKKQIEDEVEDLLAQINIHELVSRASTLRDNIGCKFQPGKYIGNGAIMGCANYHAWLHFEDGEKWLVRIPRKGLGDVPDDLIEYFVTSEYSTLKYLGSTQVPAPKVFGYGLTSDPSNRVGVSYLLMQALPGNPFDPYDATAEQKDTVFKQLAEILIEIHKHPVRRAGSLVYRNGRFEVMAAASNRFVALGQYGPFDNAVDYLVGITENYLDLIADGQLYHEYPEDAFLFYVTLRDNAYKLVGDETPAKFFLKHVDDKGDHLLVDEKGNITGIIDWQFARCVPACEAFGPSYFTADLNCLYSGKPGITGDDRRLARELRLRGADQLAEHMERNELARRFHHGLASGLAKDEACELIKGALVAFGRNDTVDLDIWREQTRKRCENDPRWQRIKTL